MDTDRIKKNKELLQLSHVKEDPMNIKDIKSPSERVQLYAVAHNCNAIEHIKNPTDRVRKTAMLCADADYIRKNTPPRDELLEMLSANGLLLGGVDDPDETMQLTAVGENGLAIQFIKNPSFSVQLAAVAQNGDSVRYIENPCEEVQITSLLESCGESIRHIHNPSKRAADFAIDFDPQNVRYIEDLNEEQQLNVIRRGRPLYIKYITDPKPSVQTEAVMMNPNTYGKIKYPCKEASDTQKTAMKGLLDKTSYYKNGDYIPETLTVDEYVNGLFPDDFLNGKFLWGKVRENMLLSDFRHGSREFMKANEKLIRESEYIQNIMYWNEYMLSVIPFRSRYVISNALAQHPEAVAKVSEEKTYDLEEWMKITVVKYWQPEMGTEVIDKCSLADMDERSLWKCLTQHNAGIVVQYLNIDNVYKQAKLLRKDLRYIRYIKNVPGELLSIFNQEYPCVTDPLTAPAVDPLMCDQMREDYIFYHAEDVAVRDINVDMDTLACVLDKDPYMFAKRASDKKIEDYSGILLKHFEAKNDMCAFTVKYVFLYDHTGEGGDLDKEKVGPYVSKVYKYARHMEVAEYVELRRSKKKIDIYTIGKDSGWEYRLLAKDIKRAQATTIVEEFIKEKEPETYKAYMFDRLSMDLRISMSKGKGKGKELPLEQVAEALYKPLGRDVAYKYLSEYSWPIMENLISEACRKVAKHGGDLNETFVETLDNFLGNYTKYRHRMIQDYYFGKKTVNSDFQIGETSYRGPDYHSVIQRIKKAVIGRKK